MRKIITALTVMVMMSMVLPGASIGTADAKLTSVKITYFKPPQVGVASTYKFEVDINQTV
jgi:hypothetical protein